MCECCSAEVDEYNVPPLGWMLCQATSDGTFMKKGQWGLVECNDPTYVWAKKPMADPLAGCVTDADWEKVTDAQMAEADTWDEAVKEFAEALKGDIESAHALYAGGIKAGYDKAKHGRFESWLYNFLARWLQANPVPTLRNRMPRNNDVGDRLKEETT